MWATLETWLLGDGQVAQLRVGDVLRGVGLRLNCESLHLSGESAAGLRLLADAATGEPSYRVRGSCLASSKQSALIDVAGVPLLAEPQVRLRHRLATARSSTEFHAPPVGAVAEAIGWLDVVPEHEWGAFHQADARTDWVLEGVFLVQHDVVPVDAVRETLNHGAILSVTANDQLLREADARPGSRYLVDLTATKIERNRYNGLATSARAPSEWSTGGY